jgi:hypothetical protein
MADGDGESVDLVSTRKERNFRWRGRKGASNAYHFTVPDQRVLRLQDPVVLIRKHDEPAGDVFGLENVERREALCYWQAIVQFVVNDLGARFRFSISWVDIVTEKAKEKVGERARTQFATKERAKGTLTNCGVAQFSTNLAGSHFSYPSLFSHRVPSKSWIGKNSSSDEYWFKVLKTPSWHTSALNLRPKGCPCIQSAFYLAVRAF